MFTSAMMISHAHGDWFKLIQNAKKTAIIQDGKRKVHFLMEDGREMVEEYHIETNVLVRRAWKEKGKLGQEIGWAVEIGDPEPNRQENFDISGIRENCNNPFITRRVTKTALEWRISNSPYQHNVYSVTAKDGMIIVSTSNKKYFKKITVPDLERIGLVPEQERISFTKKYNTLIITYKKPPQLLGFEKEILNEIMQIKVMKEGDIKCPTS